MLKLVPAFVFVVVVSVVAGALSHWTELDYWPSILIVGGAIFANGLIATFEDDSPGGFNNPDGTATPKYVTVVSWVGKAVLFLFIGASVFVLFLWFLD